MTHYEIGAPTVRHGVLEARAGLARAVCDGFRQGTNVSLWGLGGSGKSSLAAALLRDDEIRAASPDGWLWLNVGNAGSGEPTWHLQLLNWAISMGIRQDRIAAARYVGADALLKCVHDHLGDSRVLLIFDDVWNDQEALKFKNFGQKCIRLLTTPYRSVASKFSPSGLVQVGDLSERDAEALFGELAPTVLQLRPDAARDCLSEVGYLPFIVVIVATYLEASAVDDPGALASAIGRVTDVKSRYDIRADIASAEFTTLPEGSPSTLRAVIDLAASSLAAADRVALSSLAVFPPKPNSFTWLAADAVTENHEAVVAARRFGLVEDAESQGRLTMQRVIRDYALEVHETTYRRMARHFVGYVTEAHRDVDVDEWLRALRPEMANINVTLTWLTDVPERDTRLGLKLMAALWDYWYRRAYYERANGLAHRLLGVESPDASREYMLLRAKVSNDTGNFAYNMADLKTAEALHEAAMAIRTELADDTVAGSWNNLGLVYRERGQYAEAMQLFGAALERNLQTENCNPFRLKWAGFNLNNLGIAAARRGDPDAESYLSRGVEAWSATGDRWGTTMAQVDLGIYLGECLQFDKARALLMPALRERWEDGDEKLSSSALRGLAVVALGSGRVDTARSLIRAALSLSIRIRDRLGEWQSLAVLSRIDSNAGQFSEVAHVAGILDVFGAYSGMVLAPHDRVAVQKAQEASRDVLGSGYEATVVSGRASVAENSGQLDLEQAVADLTGTVDIDATVAAATAPAGEDGE